MRTKILILICLAFAVTVNAAQLKILMPVITVGGGGTPPASCTSDDIVFWWRGEAYDFSSGNGTTDYSVGDDTGTNYGTTLGSSYGKMGSGIDHPGGYDRVLFGSVHSTLDNEGRIGHWLYINTWETTACTVENCDTVFNLIGDSNNTFRLYYYDPDEIKFEWQSDSYWHNELVSTDANLSTGTWYFIEWAWKTSTNYREIFVNGTSKGSLAGPTPIKSFYEQDYASGSQGFNIGNMFDMGGDYHSDQWIISTSSTKNLYLCKDTTSYPNGTCVSCTGDVKFEFDMEDNDATPDVTVNSECGCSDGDTIGAETGSPSFDTWSSENTYSLLINALDEYYSFVVSSDDIINVDDFKITFDIHVTTLPTSGNNIEILKASGGTNTLKIIVDGTNEQIGLCMDSTCIYAGQPTYFTGQWHRVEAQGKVGAGNDLYLAVGYDSDTTDDDFSASTSATTLYLGDDTGTGTGTYNIDNLKIEPSDKW